MYYVNLTVLFFIDLLFRLFCSRARLDHLDHLALL